MCFLRCELVSNSRTSSFRNRNKVTSRISVVTGAHYFKGEDCLLFRLEVATNSDKSLGEESVEVVEYLAALPTLSLVGLALRRG